MGRISFVFMLLSAGLIVYSVTLGSNPETVSKALATVETLLIWIFGFFTSLVMSYLGVSLWEQVGKKAKEVLS
jgi:amino acid permease